MSSSVVKLGKDAGLYRNTGTYGSPTLTLVSNVADLEMPFEKDTDDVSTRGTGGYTLEVATMKTLSVSFVMNHDPADADWTAIHNMFLNDTAVEFFVLNGQNATGNQGPRATMICAKFSAAQPLKGAQRDSVELRPTVATNAPSWYTVP